MGTIRGSSLIEVVGFSGGPGESGTLRVKYAADGAVFDYFNVPYQIFRKIVTLKSPGKFWLLVRDSYKFKELK